MQIMPVHQDKMFKCLFIARLQGKKIVNCLTLYRLELCGQIYCVYLPLTYMVLQCFAESLLLLRHYYLS